MRKFIFLLMVVLILIVGAIIINSGKSSEKNQNTTQNKQFNKEINDPNVLSKGQRDTVVNTLQTISARNIKLEKKIKELEEKERNREKSTLKKRDIDAIVSRKVKENSHRLFNDMESKFSSMKNKLEKGISSKSIPSDLGFDDLNTNQNNKFSRPKLSNSNPVLSKNVNNSMGLRVIALTTIMTDKDDNQLTIDGKLSNKSKKSKKIKSVTGSKITPKESSIPFYTLPKNGTLFSNKTMTAMLGVVPVRGSIKDPIRFKVITGGTNIATNGLYIPGIRDIVWSGVAIGNREMQCVRGELHSVTFTFDDGTIRTINARSSGAAGATAKSRVGGAILGYISDQRGKPCIPGTLISNASDYLKDRIVASGEFIAGKTLAGGLGELTDYLRERQRDAVDIVYNDAGLDVVIHIEKQIEIDYEFNGRKLNHANQLSSAARYQLD